LYKSLFQKSIEIQIIVNIDEFVTCYCYNYYKNKNKSAITKISDKLWNIINIMPPKEKTDNTAGHSQNHLEK
jgi:hypothetical protein